jgi:2-polyprenyl-3-methyl-5-hydroxy-6-metoxy-1,4-benzoquinol methylase
MVSFSLPRIPLFMLAPQYMPRARCPSPPFALTCGSASHEAGLAQFCHSARNMPQSAPQAMSRRQPATLCLVCGAPLPADVSIRGLDRLLGSPGEFDVRLCDSCGTGCTTPLVPESELAKFYGRGYASHKEASSAVYAKIVHGLKRIQVAALLRSPPFLEALSAKPGRALDVGCGRGDLAAGLMAHGWQVEGVEPSPKAAALAERQGVRVVGPNLATAALARDGYDLVTLRHSLEHLPDPLGDLRRVQRVLRPGGRVVISVPNFASWQRRRFGACWFHLDLPRHRTHFTPSSLATLLQNAGLAVDMQFSSTSVLGLPASLQYRIVRRCLTPSGLPLRVGAALCCTLFPLTWLIDRVGAERDTAHVVARLTDEPAT